MKSKKIIYQLATTILLIVCCAACKKETVALFDGQDGISIDATGINRSLLQEQQEKNTLTLVKYNFAFKHEDKTQDTILIPLRVLGKKSDQLRPVDVRIVADQTTGTENVDFKIIPTEIEPLQFGGFIRVVIFRTVSLKKGSKKLMLELRTNESFPKYIYPDTLNIYNRASIEWTDLFQKPDNWDGIYYDGDYYEGYGLGAQFGEWSEAKFRLVIEVFGTADIVAFSESGYWEDGDPEKPVGEFSEGEWRNNIYRLQQILADYKQEHGAPMMDENGNEIRIPNFELNF